MIFAKELMSYARKCNKPYAVLAYSTYIAGSIGYTSVKNFWSLVSDFMSPDATLRSTTAYRDLTEFLSRSPLQKIYSFDKLASGYGIQVNNMLCDRAKLDKKSQLEKDHGEFGNKLFEHIYNSSIEEECSLLNKITNADITEQQADSLRAKHITITLGGEQLYEHCMEIKDDSMASAQYYCSNMAGQVLDRITISENKLIVIEHL